MSAELVQAVNTLEVAHSQAPLSEIAFAGRQVEAPITERLRIKELPGRNEALLLLDTPGRAALGGMDRGDVFQLYAQTPGDARPNPLRDGFVAGIVSSDAEGIDVFTIQNTQRTPDGKLHVSPWTPTDWIDAADYYRYIAGPRGVERTQLTGQVLSLDAVHRESNTPLSVAGCSSHDDPLAALPENFVLGSFTMGRTHISYIPSASESQYFARVGIDGNEIIPLASGPIDEQTEMRLVARGFVERAKELAARNPHNLGKGTQSERVMEAMIDTMDVLPELVGNGATIAQGKTLFDKTLRAGTHILK